MSEFMSFVKPSEEFPPNFGAEWFKYQMEDLAEHHRQTEEALDNMSTEEFEAWCAGDPATDIADDIPNSQFMCELGQKIYDKSVNQFISRMRSIAHNLTCLNCQMEPLTPEPVETPFKPFTERYVAEQAKRRKNVSQASLDYPAPTLMQWERDYESSGDIFKSNPDKTQSQAELEWGTTEPNYHTLFASEMDKRDFTERCYAPQGSDKLYRLEMRHSDQKPWHLQIERIMKWMSCDYQTAHAFSDCFEKLSLDRAAVVKLVFGFGPKRRGIKGTGIKHLPLLMQMVDETQSVSQIPAEDAMNFISHSSYDIEAIGEVYQKVHQYGYEAVEEEFEITEDFLLQNEQEDLHLNSAVFTAKELGRDELSLDEDLIEEIRTATWDHLKTISKRMYAVWIENEWGGYWKDPIYQHKYPSWVSDFWARIKARKSVIIQMAYKYKINPELQLYFPLFKAIPSAKQRWFLSQSMVKGGTFSFDSKKYTFPPCKPHERVFVEHALYVSNKGKTRNRDM